jgi:hypothetical protein
MHLMRGGWLARSGKWLMITLGVALGLNTLTYLNFDPSYGFLRYKQEAIATGWYLPFYYSHIFVGGLVLIAGFFQFNQSIRSRRRKLHRCLGYFYTFGILFLAAPGGLVMSLFVGRGPIVLVSFIAQCLLWIYCTAIAFRKAVGKDFSSHENWMIRSFSLTLAAITLRMYIFAASWWFDLSLPYVYGIFAWASWLPNLVIAEFIIRKKITSQSIGQSTNG